MLILVAAAPAGCQQAGPPEAAETTVLEIDTLVTAGDTVLGRPTELSVDARGLLYVTDVGRGAIVVIDSTGSVVRQIGRSGSGPGEFQAPRSATLGLDSLRLLDGGNGRLAVFTAEGSHVRSDPAPEMATAGAVAFDGIGRGVVSLNGRDSALARRFDAAGALGSRLGEVVAPVPFVWDMQAIKRQIWDGTVPNDLRNMVLPVLLPDGAVWLLLQAEGVVERYGPTDSLQFRGTLVEPEFAAIKADFFARNRADSAAYRFIPLSYFTTARPIGGDLWVLVRAPAEAATLLLVLGPDGRVRRRIRVSSAFGVRGFDLSPDHRTLYLLAYEDGAILRARLPE
ncbi:MAG: 6-bladed beta-propeller [Gemmatimonadales bacterium]